MKHMKKLLALALVVMSVMAIAAPAMADTYVSVPWAYAKGIHEGGITACIYSQMNASSQYALKNVEGLWFEVRFNTNNLNWASAHFKLGDEEYTGYVMIAMFEISYSNLKIGLFSDYTLSEGYYGQAVRNLQRYLTNVGYSTSGIDGDFGSNTENAVRSFQDDFNLAVDGYAGANTKLKLIQRAEDLNILNCTINY